MCAARDRTLVLALKEMVADYTPSAHVLQTLDDDESVNTPVLHDGNGNGNGRRVRRAPALNY
jgi:hypothetical protein